MLKKAFLIIDDCPTSDLKNKIDYLISQDIPAILFCCGNRMEEKPEAVVYAIKKGFLIGNHSYSHPNFSEITLEECYEQIKKTDDIINRLYKEAGIERHFKLFRFPYCNKGTKETGDWIARLAPKTEKGKVRKEKIQNCLREIGYSYQQNLNKNVKYNWYRNLHLHLDIDIIESYDSFDWAPTDKEPPFGYDNLNAVLARMDEDFPEEGRGINFLESDEIISMHDMYGIEDYFIPLIEKFRKKGIGFIELRNERR